MAQYYRRRGSTGMFDDIVKDEKLIKQYGIFRFSHISRAPLTDGFICYPTRYRRAQTTADIIRTERPFHYS
ncbi:MULTISPECIES: hypothetical protein [unclassified Bifidobacterium]|uniref:hypothetical protein n=1 Tax=unclassified Bifidobacterium TaxID=2608897 RepID=UPI0015E31FFC|nr:MULTISPECIES: hypothetical protein [unclassified Bifidobacterium]